MRYIFNILVILTALLLSQFAYSQVFPVQATTQLTPPYSLYLSDYVSPGSERLALNIFLADIARPNLQVKFRLRIVGQGITIETRPEYNPTPVTIFGGEPLRLISADLADYFNPANLNFQGISRSQVERQGKLPEGVYQICFEVYEYNRGIKISNTACGVAWMILNDPPLINMPRQNEKLKPVSPQNVVFQWTPRHTASPNSAFSTEYEFRLVEVWPETRNPNDAVLTSPPIFETTTPNSMLIYGPAETPLELGRRYAFRVRAKSIAGVDEMDLFKNQGYSETFTFVYGDACDLPTGVTAEAGSSRMNIKWDGRFNHTTYKVRYRPVGTTEWYINNYAFNDAEIYSLKPSTRYEYQISGACGWYEGDYTQSAFITTKELPPVDYSCGAPLETFNLDPSILTGSLKVGDIIRTGDFDVQVAKINGGSGTFSGEGVVVMPMMNKVKVKTEFSGITVATIEEEFRMVKGFMNVTGAGVEVVPEGVMNFMEQLEETLDVVDSALDLIEEFIPEAGPDPASFVAENGLTQIEGNVLAVVKDEATGKVTITTTNGETVELPPGGSYAVTDNKGKGYLVDSNGNVTKTTAENAVKASRREYNLAMRFEKDTQTKYGLDIKKVDALAHNYEKLGDDYYVPWKAVDTGSPDAAKAILSGTVEDISRIHFIKSSLPVETAPPVNNEWRFTQLQGIAAGETESIVAFNTPADTSQKEQVLGKVNVVAYDKIINKLIIVPVNGTTYPYSTANLSNQLNAIFKQAVAEWEVSFDNSNLQITLGDQFDDGASGLLSNYTDDMKKVIAAYKSRMQSGTFYLFLVKNPKTGSTAGVMPRSKQVGFIFVDKHNSESQIVSTIAHELGHGAFNLEHIFSDYPALSKGSTDNLMDYNDGRGIELMKYQWDKIHNPQMVIGLFEEDEEGRYALDNVEISTNPEEPGRQDCFASAYYLSPSGQPFKNDGNIESVAISRSVLYVITAITDKTNTVYRAEFDSEGKFIGYFHRPEGGNAIEFTPSYTTEASVTVMAALDYGDRCYYKYHCIPNWTAPDDQTANEISRIIGNAVSGDPGFGRAWKGRTSESPECQSVLYILDATQKNLATEIYSKLEKIFGGSHTNRLTGQTARLKGKVILSSKEDALNTKKVEIRTEGGIEVLYFGGVPVEVPYDEILFWLEVDGTKINVRAVQYGEYIGEAMQVSTDAWKDWVEWDQKSFLEKIGTIGYETIDGYFTALYDLMDLLSTGIGHLQLPPSVYDCTLKDGSYNPWYAEVFSWINIMSLFNDYLFEEVKKMHPQLESVTVKPSQIQFALFCGVYNGLIDVVKSVPDMLKLVLTPFTSKGRDAASGQIDQFTALEIVELNEDGTVRTIICSKEDYLCKVLEMLKEGISKMFDTSTPCLLSYNVGSIIGPVIVMCVGDVAAGEAVIARVASTTLKIIKWCDKFTDPFRYMGMVTRIVKNPAGKLLLQIRNSTGNLLEQLDNGYYKIKVFLEGQTQPTERVYDEALTMSVLSQGADGRTVEITTNGIRERFILFDGKAWNEAFQSIANRIGITTQLLSRFKAAGVLEVNVEKIIARYGKDKLENLITLFEALPDKDAATIRRLVNDLEESQDIVDAIKAGTMPIRSWNLVFKKLGPGSILRKDLKLLKKLSELMDNQQVSTALGGEDGIADILYAYRIAKCSICGNKGHKYLKYIDEYLEDVKIFVDKFQGLRGKGFEDVITTMKNPNARVLDGLTHMLDNVKRYDPEIVDAFEGRIADGLSDADDLAAVCDGCLFDVKFTGQSFAEFKSYSLSTIKGISEPRGVKFVKQFKQYIQSIGDVDDLRYVFNSNKIEDVNLIKAEFQNLFKNKTDEMFNVYWENQSLRSGLFPDINDPVVGLNSFKTMTNNLNSALYGFVVLY